MEKLLRLRTCRVTPGDDRKESGEKGGGIKFEVDADDTSGVEGVADAETATEVDKEDELAPSAAMPWKRLSNRPRGPPPELVRSGEARKSIGDAGTESVSIGEGFIADPSGVEVVGRPSAIFAARTWAC